MQYLWLTILGACGLPYIEVASTGTVIFPEMTSLSIPTWIIHISSVIEWVVAIWFAWIYAEVSNNKAWKPFAVAMLPSLVSAMCACTWHFFDNQPHLDWLVTIQAATTVLGNTTLCIAAAYLWRCTQPSLK